MARRGTTRFYSDLHEKRVAAAYGGTQSPSSGGAASDRGDVRIRAAERGTASGHLFECKHRGTYDKPAASVTLKLADFEKIADEAWSEGKTPGMALSIYAPDSVLADRNGFVDVAVRLMRDDAELLRG